MTSVPVACLLPSLLLLNTCPLTTSFLLQGSDRCGRTPRDPTTFLDQPMRPRILGGREAREGEFPWLVSIQLRDPVSGQWVHNCGGALLSHWIILTAAHCDTDRSGQESRIVAGCHRRQPGMQQTLCQVIDLMHGSFLSHPGFARNGSRVVYDVGLIRLPRPVVFTDGDDSLGGAVAPVCLPRDASLDPVTGQAVLVAGWGLMAEADERYAVRGREHLAVMSDVLKVIQLKVMPQENCATAYPGTYDPRFLHCVGSERMFEDSCGGDSGGPLMVRDPSQPGAPCYFAVGVVSRGLVCGRGSRYPSVYTRISTFLPWIEAVTGGRMTRP